MSTTTKEGKGMKRTHSVGAILHGHRPPKFRDRNVFATLLFGIFCVVVFEMFFLFFVVSKRDQEHHHLSTTTTTIQTTRRNGGNRRELPFALTSSHAGASNTNEMVCVPSIERDAKPCEPAVQMQRFDTVVAAVKPTCANKLALISLRQYVNPRRIIVVTTEKRFCEKFKTAADGIECFHEDEFVDGVTKERTANAIEKFTKKKESKNFMGRSLSGWYLQQFIKLSAYKTKKLNPPLSKQYLVWDSDMILLRPMKLFDSKGRAVRAIGGNVVPSYKKTYERLMSGSTSGWKKDDEEIDNSVHYADDGTSFVAHQMIFDADVAEEMLSAFAKKSSRSSRSRRRRSSSSSSSSSHREEEEGGDDDDDDEEEDDDDNEDSRLPSWGESIIREAYKEPENAHIGFSEYESYASFVSARHPELVKSLTLKNWARNPFFAGSLGVVVTKFVREDGLCCPTSKVLKPARWRNLAYVGFEIGHAEETCGIKSPKHSDGYGW